MLGFADAYDTPFVVLWALATAVLLSHLELVRAPCALNAGLASYPAWRTRSSTVKLLKTTTGITDKRCVSAEVMTLDEVAPLALLAQLAFIATGHQTAIASVGSFSRQHACTSSSLVILDSFLSLHS